MLKVAEKENRKRMSPSGNANYLLHRLSLTIPCHPLAIWIKRQGSYIDYTNTIRPSNLLSGLVDPQDCREVQDRDRTDINCNDGQPLFRTDNLQECPCGSGLGCCYGLIQILGWREDPSGG
ncbi:hypothetical protein I314_06289 [Cryptococcus bacillisporus CA1873]|uniref:Post-SET domain-containing protein n=1 Tax=Cryptococcus bacillisporus CA1873 TaxID=1296111 RepID=A0ABR5B3H4_CRYGA|nr:hypothetical protein I314_06289 [Cryptococcus bacillisporus CA1873]|eukprot:KIR57785.1 hypothetical protein I314_06289 [Cryptococcus gattii CA1873]